jgi:riboflavin kinase/FMN adenylyltransferase
MHVCNSLESLTKITQNRSIRIALGNFDGLHVGHRKLISGLVEKARALGHDSVVVSFNPHPAQFFGKNGDFKKIDAPSLRRRFLAELGVSAILEIPFTESLAQMTGLEFLEKIIGGLPIREVRVGVDFRFGRDRSGDVALLETYCKAHGVSVQLIDPVKVDGQLASSSMVRSILLQEGDVARAAKILCRPFCIVGTVVRGDQIGRSIGFPTANIEVTDQVIPKVGVYAGALRVQSEISPQVRQNDFMPCVINIGFRPTVDCAPAGLRVEAHIYDSLDLALYSEPVELEFWSRLRDERQFNSLEELKLQIAKDIMRAKDHASV